MWQKDETTNSSEEKWGKSETQTDSYSERPSWENEGKQI